MMKQPVFLAEEGITQTSANYLANLAKEVIKEDEYALANTSFLNKEVELINGNRKTLSMGAVEFTFIPECINRIAQMNAFCAYMREAIRAKEAYSEELISFDDWVFENKIELPERPDSPDRLSSEDVIDSWSIKKRNEYFTLEAYAAAYGKYIHEQRAISSARELLLEKVKNPSTVSGEGRDMVIYSYSPSIEVSVVNQGYMKLQSEYREYERRLNALKFEIKETISKDYQTKNTEYSVKLSEYRNEIKILESQYTSWIEKERNRRAKLKIMIPEKLKAIYNFLEQK